MQTQTKRLVGLCCITTAAVTFVAVGVAAAHQIGSTVATSLSTLQRLLGGALA